MPQQGSAGPPRSPPRNPSTPSQAIRSPPRRDPSSSSLSPQDQQNLYNPQTPIRFYDDEVKRMHDELDKRADDDRAAARKALRSPARRRRSGVTLPGFFARVAIFYLLIAWALVCPTDTSRERAVCRGIDSVEARLRAYEPVVRPYYRTAQRKVLPYVVELQHRAEPYVAKVRPHYQRVDRFTRPYLHSVDSKYRNQVHPRLVAGVHRSQAITRPYVERAKAQYTKTLQPSVEWYADALHKWYAAKVEAHLSVVTSTLNKHSRTAYDAVSPIYTTGVPLAQHHFSTHIVPFSRQAYSTSRRTYVKHVHPRALTLGRHSAAFYRTRVLPALQRFWSRFVDPQLDKIRERIFEYQAKKVKLEAIQRVEKKADEIAKEHGEDDLDAFIKDLRGATDHAAAPIETPAIPEDAPPAYSSSVPPPPPSAEEAALATAEKRRALEALQAAYESEIAALGQAEQRLLVDRLVAIRKHALEDVPARFEATLEALDEEGDKMVGKLGKYFAKVQAEAEGKTPVEDKVKDADVLCDKATARVRKMAEAIKAEVEEYSGELEAKETTAVKKAQEAVSALVAKAQSELGVGYTWLDDVSPKDWQRYHALRKADENLSASFSSLRTGAIKDTALAALDSPYTLLDDYRQQPDRLVAAFEQILEKIKVKGQKELKGEWLGVVPEAQKAYDAVSGKFGAVVSDLKESASSVAGVERKPTNVAQSVSSLAKAAQASASSVAQEALNALPTIEAQQEYLAAAKNAYGDASQTVLRAAGIEPSPTDIKQTASSLASKASASAAHAYAEASQSALRAVGKEPSPTDLAQSFTSVANVASASAASAYSQVLSDYPSSISSALAAATQAVDRAAEDALSSAADLASSAASVVSSLAAPAATLLNPAPIKEALEGAAGKANDFFGEVSQTALSAAGVEPSPTDLAQSASSVSRKIKAQASSVATAAKSAIPKQEDVKTARSSASSFASSAKSAAAASASSLSAAAGKAVHDATRTTPEGVRETVSSVVSAASKSASAASSAVSKSASSAAGQASQSAKSVASKASSLRKPHPAYTASQARASVSKATASVKSAASSVGEAASRAVHDATRTTAEGVRETLEAVKEKVEELRSPHESYRASQARASVASATQKVKEAVKHVEL
ncbi:hypothetical protein JCM8097_007272 [Rhodosporidiobolus ruineniae]